MISSKEYKNRFEKLYQLLTRAHLCFYVWKGLQNKEYQPQFDRDNNFWSATLYSLEEAWLQSLANIYENSKYSEKDKIISVYSLVRNQKDKKRKVIAQTIIWKNRKLLKNLSVLRHHQLSHYNANHLLNSKDILRKFPIVYGDVEKLLGFTENLLHCLHPDSNHSFAFDGFDKKSEKSSSLVMKRIKYYLDQEKEHYDKTKYGNKYIEFPSNGS